ncbi:MAG: LacI family DNA-binding transcriptional regulator [Rhizobiaceae bacterium]
MPTVKDVARQAGVSVGTVSRVLANEPSVKKHLRDKVEAAILELKYRPNFAARALRTNQIDMIGFIVPDITNPFFAQLAQGIEAQVDMRGHTVMLASSHNDPKVELKHINAFIDRSARGIVIIAVSDIKNFDIKTDIPIVSLDRRFADYPLVATNHIAGATLVADHLYDLGHRHIAYIAGSKNTEVGRARQLGFEQRIHQLSSSRDPIQLDIHFGRFDYESGEEIARQILNVPLEQRPTAIAAASDQQAIGTLRVARDLELKLPHELSVAGFDDITLAHLVVPRLTTVRQPTDELARRALEIVFSEVKDNSDHTIDGVLIHRGSTSEFGKPAPRIER